MKRKILAVLCMMIGCLMVVNEPAFCETIKPSCTVLLFHPDVASISEAQGRQITDRFVELLNRADLYYVIDYNYIEKNISSQTVWRLTESCTEKECAMKVGKIVNSDYIIYGVISDVGNIRSLETTLLDVKKGDVINSVETTHEGDWDVFARKGPEANLQSLLGITFAPEPEAQPEQPSQVKRVVGANEEAAETAPQKKLTFGPRIGLAVSDDDVEVGAGVEARYLNLSFRLFGNNVGVGAGLGYYLQAVGDSPYVSAVWTYYDKDHEIGRIYGVMGGYRIDLAPHVDACLGLGVGYIDWDRSGVAPGHKRGDEEIVPLGEITVGYMF